MGVYLLTLILSIPFPFYFIPGTGVMLLEINSAIIGAAGEFIFPRCTSCIWPVISDSAGLWSLAFLSLFISFPLYCLVAFFKAQKLMYEVLLFFLVIHLMKYGFAKILYQQFSPPEANILFTPLGYLEKDILYWSTMGSSYFYNLFLGTIEVLTGILILFRNSRPLGLLMSLGIMLQILSVNIGFDVDVKFFSMTLLIISLYLSTPVLKGIVEGLRTGTMILSNPTHKSPRRSRIIKHLALVLILIECSYPIQSALEENRLFELKTLDAFRVINDSEFARLFIHSAGYLIVQNKDLSMQDNRVILVPEGYYLPESNTTLEFYGERNKLYGMYGGSLVDWQIEPIDIDRLPLLQDSLEWMVKTHEKSYEYYPP